MCVYVCERAGSAVYVSMCGDKRKDANDGATLEQANRTAIRVAHKTLERRPNGCGRPVAQTADLG
jgi:hypothetical protein